MSKNKAGLVLGIVMGTLHLVWSILVATQIAQRLLNFVYRMHFLNNPFTVAEFSLQTALMLVVLTFVVGYVVGWFFVLLWGALHKK